MSKKDERKPRPPHMPQETPQDGPDETKGEKILNVSVNIDFENIIETYTAGDKGWLKTDLINITVIKGDSSETIDMGFCISEGKNQERKIVLFELSTGVPFGKGEAPEENDDFLENLSQELCKLISDYIDHERSFLLYAATVVKMLSRAHGPRPGFKQDVPKHLH